MALRAKYRPDNSRFWDPPYGADRKRTPAEIAEDIADMRKQDESKRTKSKGSDGSELDQAVREVMLPILKALGVDNAPQAHQVEAEAYARGRKEAFQDLALLLHSGGPLPHDMKEASAWAKQRWAQDPKLTAEAKKAIGTSRQD